MPLTLMDIGVETTVKAIRGTENTSEFDDWGIQFLPILCRLSPEM